MTKDTTTVVIAAAADGKYALPLAVMLRSAASHLRPSARIEAYVVDDGISTADREKVETSIPASVVLNWVNRPPGEFDGLPSWGRMSLATYHKLTLGEWLPANIDGAIWLDVDTLVLRDLAELWETDLADKIALAGQDAGVRFVSSRFGVAAFREFGVPATTRYFNAGVMLIDLARWRREQISGRAFDYLRQHHRRVFFWDQEALNAALAGRCGILDPRWNWKPLINRQGDPWIIHFSGNLKPWRSNNTSEIHKLYYHSLDQTAWRGWRPPSSWRGRILARYESSRLRALLYPLEQFHLPLVRWMTRR